MFNIEFYREKNGISEVEEYIKKLNSSNNKEDRIKYSKISAYMDLLHENGLSLKEPYIKKIDKEIWELRPIRDRILFAIVKEEKFFILNYFIKKTQKTPKKEIDKAKRLLNDYMNRGNM